MNITRDYEQLKNNLNIELLVKSLLPDGKGFPEWCAKNPTRDDKHAGSFTVNLQTGMWLDFATGDKGDIIGLFAYINGVTQSQAYDVLSDGNKFEASPEKRKQPIKSKRPFTRLIYPAPSDSGEPVISHHDGYWRYKNNYGELLMCVSRHEPNEIRKKKSFVIYTYREEDLGFTYWAPHAEGLEERPLLHQDVLHNCPDSNVLVVEGETTVDAAIKLLPDWAITTWHGGANIVNRVNLEPLRGRNVWLWPDNDDAGIKAMNQLHFRLTGVASSITVVDIPRKHLAEHWDLADGLKQGIKTDEVMEFLNKKKPNTLDALSFPKLSEKGRPINSYDNTECLMKYDGISVRLNLMTHYPEYDCGGKLFKKREDLKYYICYLSNRCVEVGIPKVDLESHLTWLAKKNEYHPAVDYINSKPWDGISRITEFFETIEAENPDLANRLLFRWMLGCVAAAFSDEGVSLGGILVFQGAQGLGKTAWFLKLVSKDYQYIIKDGLSLDPDNKDSVMDCTSSWLVELAELDGTIRKSQAAAQKRFLTKSKDSYRAPYGKNIISVERRTSFFGSVNPSDYLKDVTGNRRFWTVSVKSINYEHNIDMQQVWAEFKTLLDEGESYHLNKKEFMMLNEENEEFQILDPIEEMILNKYHWEEEDRCNPMTSTGVLLDLNFELQQFKIDITNKKCSAILTKLTGKKSHRGAKGIRLFYLPRVKV